MDEFQRVAITAAIKTDDATILYNAISQSSLSRDELKEVLDIIVASNLSFTARIKLNYFFKKNAHAISLSTQVLLPYEKSEYNYKGR